MSESNKLTEQTLSSTDDPCELTRGGNRGLRNWPTIDKLATIGLTLTALGWVVLWFGSSPLFWKPFVLLTCVGFITSLIARVKRKTRLTELGVVAGLLLLLIMWDGVILRGLKNRTIVNNRSGVGLNPDPENKKSHTETHVLPEQG